MDFVDSPMAYPFSLMAILIHVDFLKVRGYNAHCKGKKSFQPHGKCVVLFVFIGRVRKLEILSPDDETDSRTLSKCESLRTNNLTSITGTISSAKLHSLYSTRLETKKRNLHLFRFLWNTAGRELIYGFYPSCFTNWSRERGDVTLWHQEQALQVEAVCSVEETKWTLAHYISKQSYVTISY